MPPGKKWKTLLTERPMESVMREKAGQHSKEHARLVEMKREGGVDYYRSHQDVQLRLKAKSPGIGPREYRKPGGEKKG